MRGLEPIDAVIVERRHVAVLARRQPFEPGLAGMHDQRVDAGAARPRAVERVERLLGILLVDADAALDGDRHAHARLHGGDAVADQRRLRHQAGAEAALLHAVRRAADIEVDLVDSRSPRRSRAHSASARGSQPPSCSATGCSAGSKPSSRARSPWMHRAGRDHLGVEQRAARQQAMEEPAMPVRPVHHRRDGEDIFLIRQCLTLCL